MSIFNLLTVHCFLFFSAVIPFFLAAQESNDSLIPTEEIRIRDPFIYADSSSGLYYMYAQIDNRLSGKGGPDRPKGVEVYISADLQNWESPKPVLLLPDDFWAKEMVWAPEMHEYNGKFYLFVTLTSADLHDHLVRPEGVKDWPPFHKRGTHIFHSDSPSGPFQSFDDKPHTPEDWMALDGTLYVEDEIPYMIFCREWVEVVDGTMESVKLAQDLSRPIGNPRTLFHASEAEWSIHEPQKVTDGCYMYKTKEEKLLMIWSSFGEKGYAIGIAESQSGQLKGPWVQQKDLLFEQDGGHGMIFKTFDDRLMLVFHQPNSPGGQERMKMFEIEDVGHTIQLK